MYQSNSIYVVQESFKKKFKKMGTPSRSVILNIVSNFEKYNTVHRIPPNKKNTGQKHEEAKNELKKLVSEIHNLLIRKAACAVGVSPTLVYHMLIFT